MANERNPVKASLVATRVRVTQSLPSVKHHPSQEDVTTPFYYHLLGFQEIFTTSKPVSMLRLALNSMKYML